MIHRNLDEFMLKRGGSVDPSRFVDETFELLSIPAFDKGVSEIVEGRNIGSSKKCVEPNDILLSKIVPHVRRCWVVPPKGKYRQIASGEWIQFRSDQLHSEYLKFFLISDPFHCQFMSTVSGVGGSLLRASPSQVAKIKIPVLPLAEQQKIVSILAAADSLRQKDQQLIGKYNALSQSLFFEMFGDPVVNPNNFPISKLSDAYINAKEGTKCGPFGSALKKSEYIDQGIPVWVMDNIQKYNFVFEKCLFITEEKYLSLNSYSTLGGDIIISRAGTVGKMCVVPDGYKQAIISTNLIRLRLDNKILLPLFFVLLMKYFATKVGRIKTGPDGSFTHMNTGVLNDLTFPFPPIILQKQFAKRIQSIEAQKQQAQTSLEKSEALFNSLLQRAFKGELTT